MAKAKSKRTRLRKVLKDLKAISIPGIDTTSGSPVSDFLASADALIEEAVEISEDSGSAEEVPVLDGLEEEANADNEDKDSGESDEDKPEAAAPDALSEGVRRRTDKARKELKEVGKIIAQKEKMFKKFDC